MTDLIKSPQSPWNGFFRGAGTVFLTLIWPLGFMAIRASKTTPDIWARTGLLLVLLVVVSIIAGVLFAIPALLYSWAYHRVGGDSEL